MKQQKSMIRKGVILASFLLDHATFLSQLHKNTHCFCTVNMAFFLDICARARYNVITDQRSEAISSQIPNDVPMSLNVFKEKSYGKI